MASFVIHTIAAETFLKKLESEGIKLTDSEKNEFLLGNLITDSVQDIEGRTQSESKKIYRIKAQEEKAKTHFKNEDDKDLCIQCPNTLSFETKYDSILKEYSTLGYLFHLYTDKVFFDDLFKASFETLDENMNPTIYTSKTKYVLVRKNNKIMKAEDLFNAENNESIYHDYTVMNKFLLGYFGATFDVQKLLSYSTMIKNPGIEEVDFANLGSVITKTHKYIKESYAIEKNTLNVFSEQEVINFINYITDLFLKKYKNYFGKTGKSLRMK